MCCEGWEGSGGKGKGFMLYLLFKVCSCSRNLGQVFIEQIFLCSQAVILYVSRPVEGAGVEIEFLKQRKRFSKLLHSDLKLHRPLSANCLFYYA